MSRFASSTFAKPENALKRAEELMNVGQKQAALQALHDVITSKRHRTWQKTLERIMFKYIDLCVDMRKGRYAKDGLIQYRIVCQQVNVSSLEEVIKYFLKLSTERAEAAQAAAHTVTVDVEDLEEDHSPEDIMLSFVSAEKDKDRADRELVTPWFKFLWETYRTVLEILRNNSKLETLYAMTAHRAFQFCLQYKRNTEFRRLCEILRNHLTNLNKYRDQRDRPDLTLPETLQLYLETRFEQLKVATDLELWQEAFRSVEDIHGLLGYAKKAPKPQMMATYYAKLTKVFWVSENYLYHAYAWYKLYNLSKTYNKNLTQKDLQMMASSVLLATLAVPPYDRKHNAHHFELEMEKDRNLRMANLLGFSLDPKRDAREVLSRSALLAELNAKGIMAHVPPEIKDLYQLVENDFQPLALCAKAQPLLAKLPEISEPLSAACPITDMSLSQYVPAMEKLSILRLLQQVTQVYQTMKIPHLAKMIPFCDFVAVEKIVVDAMNHNFLQLRISHQNQTVYLGAQVLENDKIRNHITVLAKRLNKAVSMMYPEGVTDKEAMRKEAISQAMALAPKEHKNILARKVLIEKRKEEQERLMLETEREEELRKLHQQRLTEEAEAKRLASEAARREEERIRMQIEEQELEEARALLEAAEKRKGKKGKGRAGETTDVKLDKRALMEEALSEQIKERQEMERKLQKLARTLDYVERAKREEERPLLQAAYEQKLVDDQQYHQERQKEYAEQHRAHWEVDILEKKRLSIMVQDQMTFQRQVMTRRADEFEQMRLARLEELAELRAMRQQDRERRRKMEYFRRMELERMQAEREAEEARRAAEEEARRREQEERQRKLDEIARLQREKEEEIERQKAAERERLLREVRPAASVADTTDRWTRSGPPREEPPARYTPPVARAGMDRDRPAERPRFERPSAEAISQVRERDGAYRAPAERERDGVFRPPAERDGGYRPPVGDRAPPPRDDRRGRDTTSPPPREADREERWGRRDGPPPPPPPREGAYRPPVARRDDGDRADRWSRSGPRSEQPDERRREEPECWTRGAREERK